ncbi:unnamed protein product [Vicia faba]|uniref:Uncharacterized protein n=1 Tax=Vicia faba TaxID=3906 RepID=A0AAV1B030_VICFA|nr:unnamed protein product [Vicia faba]
MNFLRCRRNRGILGDVKEGFSKLEIFFTRELRGLVVEVLMKQWLSGREKDGGDRYCVFSSSPLTFFSLFLCESVIVVSDACSDNINGNKVVMFGRNKIGVWVVDEVEIMRKSYR